jgi:phospholipid/cholesterol/gamma-HCH transport system ATP-binding protein
MNLPIIQIKGLENTFGTHRVHRDLDLTIYQGDIVALIGGSGTGKTTLLRSILRLNTPTKGEITVLNNNIHTLSTDDFSKLCHQFGMMFQHSALFSSLSVLENVCFPMREFSTLPNDFIETLGKIKLSLVGLHPDVSTLYPSELSGGMQRRVAAARAIVMDPHILFLDEPTTGLDPISARRFDALILSLHQLLKLTIVMISHDIDSLKAVPNKIAFIGEGKILALAPYDELIKNPHPLIADYFNRS